MTTTTDTMPTIDELGLDYIWLDNGAPLFYGTVDKVTDLAESAGFQIYYVVANYKVSEKNASGVTTYQTRPAMFQVINNLVGRAILEVKDPGVFTDMKPEAWFSLPKIPYDLVQKMDEFFRAVDAKFHTEAVVLLTFDPEIGDSSGWGLLVPDQKNTSANCDFTPESVADEKPEHVFIVGSVHSHPGMSAYASGVDHNDQAEWDGLHITYGWQKAVNGGATQYHAEMTMGGTNFRLNPDQIFGDMPAREPDATVLQWTEKVEKKTSTSQTWSGGSAILPAGSTSKTNYTTMPAQDRWKIKLPDGAPNMEENIIIGMLLDREEQKCPFCDTILISQDLVKRRCLACHSYICLPSEGLDNVVKVRVEAKVYSYELDVKKQPGKSIYAWVRDPHGLSTFHKWYTAPTKTQAGGVGGK